MVHSLVQLHGCAGWPGYILVAKANYFRFQQDKGLKKIRKQIQSQSINSLLVDLNSLKLQ